MGDELHIRVSEEWAEAEQLDALTGYLRKELLQLDVEDVWALPSGQTPPGSRDLDHVAVGGLLVMLSRSADGLRAVVLAVRRWLARGDGVRRTVGPEIGGDVLELSSATASDRQRRVEMFVRRHVVDAVG